MVPFVVDDMIRCWFRPFEEDGIDGRAWFGREGSTDQLGDARQEKRKARIAAALPRSTRQVCVDIAKECGVIFESRSGLCVLLLSALAAWAIRMPAP